MERLRRWARRLKTEAVALWLAARDRRTPVAARIVAAATAAYALSPIDLIPDVIPVLGYLDDLLIVPLGLMVAIRLVPPPLMAEFRQRAAEVGAGRAGRIGAVLVVLAWAAAVTVGAALLWHHAGC
ncbi:DUF1232 domain-containing protein [Rhodobacterales bacterium HKCCE3408]|nr:DUF1232 domain-containing protein [Rhodobacterales bacterium HKCCE3408]